MMFPIGFGVLGAVRQLLGFAPSSLFANSEPGAWYDPSDLRTMFQDAAGTTPVTAVEQPVGLILDKSKGLVLGPELVTNGTFDTDTAWTKGAGVTISSGRANLASATANAIALEQTGYALSVGRFYRITFNVSNYVSGAINLRFGNNTLNTIAGISANGSYTYLISPANVGTQSLSFYAQTTTATLAIDNISVRELPGNHATQTTSTSMPVLSARYNLLTKTEQFDDATWAKSNVTVTANAATAPNGTLTADEMTTSGVAGVQRVFQGATPTGALTFSVYAKATTARYLQLTYTSEPTVFANFDLLSGTVGTVGTGVTSNSITSVGNGWYQCTVSGNISAGSGSWAAYIIPASNSAFNAAFTATVASIYIWGASLVPANQVSLPYQRVNTATDYDADPSKFKPYLRFDGVDDWLVTPTITPGTDKAQVFAGVRKLSDAAFGMIAEFSPSISNNSGAFSVNAGNLSVGAPAYAGAFKGTLFGSFQTGNSFPAPITSVLTSHGDISGDSAILRVNGTQAAQSTADQGTGNFLAYPLYIGRRGGTTLPFNGHIYGLIVRFGANLPAGTIASTETWLNGKTGAY